MLTLERLKHLLSYDPETGLFTWINRPCTWSKNKVGDVDGNFGASGVLRVCIDKESFCLDQLAVYYMTGAYPAYVDHLDDIRTNNRYSNLIISTKRKRKAAIAKRLAEVNKWVYLQTGRGYVQ